MSIQIGTMARTYQPARISCGKTDLKTKVEWVEYAPTDAAGNIVEPLVPTKLRRVQSINLHSNALARTSNHDKHPLCLKRENKFWRKQEDQDKQVHLVED